MSKLNNVKKVLREAGFQTSDKVVIVPALAGDRVLISLTYGADFLTDQDLAMTVTEAMKMALTRARMNVKRDSNNSLVVC